MRFRRNAPLGPGQVTDMRGRGCGVAIGGGGLGILGLVIYLLIALLSNAGGGLGQLAPLDQQTVGQSGQPGQVDTRSDISDCRTREDAYRRDDCRIVGVVNSMQKLWEVSSRRGELVYIDLGFFDELKSRFGGDVCLSCRD